MLTTRTENERPRIQLRGLQPGEMGVSQEWYGDGFGRSSDDFEPNPIVATVIHWLRQVVETINNSEFRDKELFQGAMWVFCQLGVSEKEIAELFSATPNAINRWMNGKTAPTTVVRCLAVRASLDILRRDGIHVAGRRYDAVTGRPIETLD
jgi:hypothetical protein